MARKHFGTVKVMKYGRITIPSDIRELEGIGQGNYVQISIEKIEEATDGNRQEPIPEHRRYAKENRRSHESQGESKHR